MTIYLLPYEYDRPLYKNDLVRYNLNNNGLIHCRIRLDFLSYFWLPDNSGTVSIKTKANSIEEAKQLLDQKLIEQGYILIPEDKVEQYKALL